jgi:hypothetical protein
MSLHPAWNPAPPSQRLTNIAQFFRTVTHMSGMLMVPLRHPGFDSLVAISLATQASRWYALHTVNKGHKLNETVLQHE